MFLVRGSRITTLYCSIHLRNLRSFIVSGKTSYISIVFLAEDIVIFLSHSPWQSFWHVMVVARCQIGSKRILIGNFFAEIGHTRAMKFLLSLMEKMSCTFQTLYCTVLLLNMNSFIMTTQCFWLNMDLLRKYFNIQQKIRLSF